MLSVAESAIVNLLPVVVATWAKYFVPRVKISPWCGSLFTVSGECLDMTIAVAQVTV